MSGMKSKTKELLKTIGYALAMMLCIGLTGGGIKSGASVLLQDGFFSRWWLGAVFAVTGIYLARLTAEHLNNSVKKRRKSRWTRVGRNTPCGGKRRE